ncbi:Netrin-G2 [Liparis tanakae]|uniref:Netrin-G2 n=1 Tax=Liparis tanakae TaxID=230148 RepID=A0A4Z2GEE7_9TELE|nr:Netrin-G2 [Liparis tanakae]
MRLMATKQPPHLVPRKERRRNRVFPFADCECYGHSNRCSYIDYLNISPQHSFQTPQAAVFRKEALKNPLTTIWSAADSRQMRWRYTCGADIGSLESAQISSSASTLAHGHGNRNQFTPRISGARSPAPFQL